MISRSAALPAAHNEMPIYSAENLVTATVTRSFLCFYTAFDALQKLFYIFRRLKEARKFGHQACLTHWINRSILSAEIFWHFRRYIGVQSEAITLVAWLRTVWTSSILSPDFNTIVA